MRGKKSESEGGNVDLIQEPQGAHTQAKSPCLDEELHQQAISLWLGRSTALCPLPSFQCPRPLRLDSEISHNQYNDHCNTDT